MPKGGTLHLELVMAMAQARPTAFPPAAAEGGSAPVEAISAEEIGEVKVRSGVAVLGGSLPAVPCCSRGGRPQ